MSDSIWVLVLFATAFLVVAYVTVSKRSYYSDNHPILNQIRHNFGMINPEYSKIPLREGNSAYTENKSVITLCLKDPKTGKYYDMNTMMYVALHELAHMVSKTHGHGDEFTKNFSILLRKGAKLGFYDPRIPIPNTYCGLS